MFGRLATTCSVALLRLVTLSTEDRTRLTCAILDRLHALPASDIISLNEQGQFTVGGRPLTMEDARKLRESAKYVLDSSARKIVREAVAFKAVSHGVHKANTPEEVLFSKAALWQGQQEDELYRMLAQE